MQKFSAGVIAGSNPERIVVTSYDSTGRVSRKRYYTIDEFRATHNAANSDDVERAIEEARQNVLRA